MIYCENFQFLNYCAELGTTYALGVGFDNYHTINPDKKRAGNVTVMNMNFFFPVFFIGFENWN